MTRRRMQQADLGRALQGTGGHPLNTLRVMISSARALEVGRNKQEHLILHASGSHQTQHLKCRPSDRPPSNPRARLPTLCLGATALLVVAWETCSSFKVPGEVVREAHFRPCFLSPMTSWPCAVLRAGKQICSKCLSQHSSRSTRSLPETEDSVCHRVIQEEVNMFQQP